jgi:hypothetical protein
MPNHITARKAMPIPQVTNNPSVNFVLLEAITISLLTSYIPNDLPRISHEEFILVVKTTKGLVNYYLF